MRQIFIILLLCVSNIVCAQETLAIKNIKCYNKCYKILKRQSRNYIKDAKQSYSLKKFALIINIVEIDTVNLNLSFSISDIDDDYEFDKLNHKYNYVDNAAYFIVENIFVLIHNNPLAKIFQKKLKLSKIDNKVEIILKNTLATFNSDMVSDGRCLYIYYYRNKRIIVEKLLRFPDGPEKYKQFSVFYRN